MKLRWFASIFVLSVLGYLAFCSIYLRPYLLASEQNFFERAANAISVGSARDEIDAKLAWRGYSASEKFSAGNRDALRIVQLGKDWEEPNFCIDYALPNRAVIKLDMFSTIEIDGVRVLYDEQDNKVLDVALKIKVNTSKIGGVMQLWQPNKPPGIILIKRNFQQ